MTWLTPRLRDARVAWAVVALAVVAAFILVFFVVPSAVVSSDVGPPDRRTELENGVRSAAAQFVAGLVLAFGLYFTARTLRLNREAQLTERFSKAIEHLGSKELDVRLGGIYALERIARDSKRDHGPVMEVLTAYARRYRRTERDQEDGAPYDVQAIMTVLARRIVAHDLPDTSLDLARSDLRGVTNVSFARANLRGTDLTGARLIDPRFDDAVYDEHTQSGGIDLGALGAKRALSPVPLHP